MPIISHSSICQNLTKSKAKAEAVIKFIANVLFWYSTFVNCIFFYFFLSSACIMPFRNFVQFRYCTFVLVINIDTDCRTCVLVVAKRFYKKSLCPHVQVKFSSTARREERKGRNIFFFASGRWTFWLNVRCTLPHTWDNVFCPHASIFFLFNSKFLISALNYFNFFFAYEPRIGPKALFL